MSRKSIRVLGVMTGTSCDGLDAACMDLYPGGWDLLWARSAPYPAALRERVLAIQKPGAKVSLQEFLSLNRDLGEWYGASISKLLAKAPRSQAPQVIANHGQTVSHFPATRRQGTTLQMGDPTRLARATGLTTVSSFRDGDMAAGGQGAPLVPMFHRMLAEKMLKRSEGVSIHNIGGISNLSYLGPKGRTLAWDTGPGNIWIDLAASQATNGKLKMDRDGKLGAQAAPDLRAVNETLKHPYFKKQPPKSTGRDDFPYELLLSKLSRKDLSGPELVSTATQLTVESIALDYERFILKKGLPLKQILICGGGAYNPTLMQRLAKRIQGVEVTGLDQAGFDPQFVEAQAFAVFGYLALNGKPVGGPWTGAEGFGPPAHIVPGENWSRVVALLGQEQR